MVTTTATIEALNMPIVSPNGEILLKDLNLKIEPGAHCIISGPNGCGKAISIHTESNSKYAIEKFILCLCRENNNQRYKKKKTAAKVKLKTYSAINDLLYMRANTNFNRECPCRPHLVQHCGARCKYAVDATFACKRRSSPLAVARAPHHAAHRT